MEEKDGKDNKLESESQRVRESESQRVKNACNTSLTLCNFESMTLNVMHFKRILYIYNPYSNEGKAKDNWYKLTKKYPFVLESSFNISEIENIRSFIKEKDPDLLVIAAGDGTITKVVSAVMKFKKRPTLGIIPLGFGNAMAYSLGVETIEKAMETILHPTVSLKIDIMKTNLPDFPFGLFNISTGFDARVIHDRNMHRYIGLRSYLLSAIRSIMTHKHKEMIFTIDHAVTLNATISSLMVANAPILGQNYLVTSTAKLNDGLLDCTVFSTKYAYIRNLRLRGFKHPFYSKIGKVHFKASHIRIEGEPYVQVDGDPVIQQRGIEIEVLKQQINFLYNKDIDMKSPTVGFSL